MKRPNSQLPDEHEILKTRIIVFRWNSSQINWTEKLDCVNANIFHGTQKSLNDNWTKTGSCEPTFMKWSYKIKLTVDCLNTNSILCLFIDEGINQGFFLLESIFQP